MQWSLNVHLVFTQSCCRRFSSERDSNPRISHKTWQRYRSCRFLRMTTLASHQELGQNGHGK
jgi:hypothetical protein